MLVLKFLTEIPCLKFESIVDLRKISIIGSFLELPRVKPMKLFFFTSAYH